MDSQPTASQRRLPFRDERGHGAIVFDPARSPQAEPGWFDPAGLGEDAQEIRGRGGRGAAWFVSGVFGDAVLRHYRRGGWMARLSEDRYAWRGEPAVRSLREFALLQRMRSAGLPVPAPIAAWYRREGWSYRAALLVERLAKTRSFADAVATAGAEAPWSEVGDAIARCHRQRARHADLNANNILIGEDGKVWLIDWDKGRFERRLGRWCGRSLARLERSLRKLCPQLPEAVLADGMRRLRLGHDRELAA